MAKRPLSSRGGSSSDSSTKKRAVTTKNVDKWSLDHYKDIVRHMHKIDFWPEIVDVQTL